MGLDMYLNKTRRLKGGENLMLLDPDEVKRESINRYEMLKPYIVKRGTPGLFEWDSYHEEVGYWRKANHIHNWFVPNVQGGEDECNPYEVTREHVEMLRDICQTIVDECGLVDGMVNSGYTANKPIMEPGKIMTNAEVAEELLPTTSGFFFGGTDYDEYYMVDVQYTLMICEKVLKDFDFENNVLFYRSSW